MQRANYYKQRLLRVPGAKEVPKKLDRLERPNREVSEIGKGRRTARAAPAARASCRVPARGWTGNGPFGVPSPDIEQSTQNWYGQGESDCLIKTKHPCGC
ncbi:hypothetical protein K1719_039478 [Acacia pycnantha]|nr:hypothetical protein K1719_039478 [Acacia pycnantha]